MPIIQSIYIYFFFLIEIFEKEEGFTYFDTCVCIPNSIDKFIKKI